MYIIKTPGSLKIPVFLGKAYASGPITENRQKYLSKPTVLVTIGKCENRPGISK